MVIESKGVDVRPGIHKKVERQKFEPGHEYFSPYKEPGKAPKGYGWVVAERNLGKGYPTGWTLRSTDPEPPDMDTLPPIEELSDFESTLHPPKDIGIPDWLEEELKD